MTPHRYPSQESGTAALAASSSSPIFWPDVATWMRDHPLAVRRSAAAAFALVAIASAGLLALQRAGSADSIREAAPATAVDPDLTRVATARTPLVDVYNSPTNGVVTQTLEHPTAAGGPLVFLVEGEWEGWFKVQLPTAPGGAQGWIRVDTVEVTENRVRLTIDLDEHVLVAYERGHAVLRAPIAVGQQDHPDSGTTFVTERLAVTNPRAGYGQLALPLAGYGNGPETLFRGQGLVAVHGVSGDVEVGQTVRNGSVALANDDMRALYELAAIGTPVDILGSEVVDSP